SITDLVANIGVVTLGNTLGGVLVATAYFLVYLANTQNHALGTAQTLLTEDELAAAERPVNATAGSPAAAPGERAVAAPAMPLAVPAPNIVTRPASPVTRRFTLERQRAA